MQAFIGVLFCVLLGVMVKAQGWFALLWLPLGFVISLFATAQIALPIMLALPRAIRLVSRGEMRSAVYIRLLLTPILWIVGLFVILFLFGFFWPAAAAWVAANRALNVGTWLGIIGILLSPLSRQSRGDFQADFDRSYGRFYTHPPPEAQPTLDEPVKNEDQHLHDDLFDFTIIGASHMAKGVTEFSAWSKVMLAEEGGESLPPFLRVIYANSKILLEKTQKHFPD